MDYFKEVNLAVTICDKEGKILEMNDKSRKTFLKPGQEDLIGKNVLDCRAGSFPVGRYVTKSPDQCLYYREERGKKTDLSDALVCGRRVYGVYGVVDGNTFRDETLREGGGSKRLKVKS